MQLNLMDINKFINVNPIKEVTNPIFLDRNKNPTRDGLLSTDIFGSSTKERTRRFGFISLGGYYFQPVVYKSIKRMDNRIDKIISGKLKVALDKNGYIVESENGQTGLDFIYKNWDKIRWKKSGSKIRDERISLLEINSKSEIFTDKWIVCPAMYRDVNMQDIDSRKMSIDTVNGLYSNLIRMTSILKQDSSYIGLMNNTRFQIQNTLVEIYDYFKNIISKKTGMIRQALLGKSVDYGARLIITPPDYNINSYKDSQVDYYHAGVPLANCCSMFTPFTIAWIREFLRARFEEREYYLPKIPEKDEFITVKDPMTFYNDDKIHKLINTFVFSYSGRFQKIEVPGHEGIYLKHKFVYYKDGNPEEVIRPLTLTDLMFLAASDVCEDKYVYITRYPMTDTMGIFPIRINVLSTIKTIEAYVNNKHFKKYPYVDLELSPEEVPSQFIDTLRFPNVYLKALVGDYDGDVVSIRGVYSQEANKEADMIMKSKINVLNMAGQNIRTTTNETVQTLYNLTRRE